MFPRILLMAAAVLSTACYKQTASLPTPAQQFGIDLARIGSGTWAIDPPSTTFVTLHYRDGRFEGSSGCNLYVGTVQQRGTTGAIAVNPELSTHRACVPAVMRSEKLFLDRLRTVTSMQVTRWDITLAYDRGADKGNLVFSPYQPPLFSIYRDY